MVNTPAPNRKLKNESEIILDTELMHENIDCPKCSQYMIHHLKTKRNYIVHSMTEFAKNMGIATKSARLHLHHLIDAGIASKISEEVKGHAVPIKLDFKHYEFQRKMPEDQILTDTDNMIAMLDGSYISIEEAARRLEGVDWANGEKVSIYAGRN